MTTTNDPIPLDDDPDAVRLAGAFLAGYASPATRRAYRVDLRYWFAFCRRHDLHPYRGIRRTHLELYLRELEQLIPRPCWSISPDMAQPQCPPSPAPAT